MQQTANDTKMWNGIGPVFGANLLSVMVTDIINMLINPIWKNIFQVLIDLAHFYLIPIVGGIYAIVVKV